MFNLNPLFNDNTREIADSSSPSTSVQSSLHCIVYFFSCNTHAYSFHFYVYLCSYHKLLAGSLSPLYLYHWSAQARWLIHVDVLHFLWDLLYLEKGWMDNHIKLDINGNVVIKSNFWLPNVMYDNKWEALLYKWYQIFHILPRQSFVIFQEYDFTH